MLFHANVMVEGASIMLLSLFRKHCNVAFVTRFDRIVVVKIMFRPNRVLLLPYVLFSNNFLYASHHHHHQSTYYVSHYILLYASTVAFTNRGLCLIKSTTPEHFLSLPTSRPAFET